MYIIFNKLIVEHLQTELTCVVMIYTYLYYVDNDSVGIRCINISF